MSFVSSRNVCSNNALNVCWIMRSQFVFCFVNKGIATLENFGLSPISILFFFFLIYEQKKWVKENNLS